MEDAAETGECGAFDGALRKRRQLIEKRCDAIIESMRKCRINDAARRQHEINIAPDRRPNTVVLFVSAKPGKWNDLGRNLRVARCGKAAADSREIRIRRSRSRVTNLDEEISRSRPRVRSSHPAQPE